MDQTKIAVMRYKDRLKTEKKQAQLYKKCL